MRVHTKNRKGVERGVLQRAGEAVRSGLSVRAASQDFAVPRTTLRRYLAENDAQGHFGYENCKIKNMVLSPEMEADLAAHITKIADLFHGLTMPSRKGIIWPSGNQKPHP